MRSLSTRMVGLLLAATAVTPVVAQAQMPGQNDRGEHGRGDRGDRGGNAGGWTRGERPQQAQQQQAQPQRQAPAQAPPHQQAEQRGDRGNRDFVRHFERQMGQTGQPADRQFNRGAPAAAINHDDRRNEQIGRDHRDDGRFQGRNDSRFRNHDDHRDNRGNWNEGRRDDHRDWNRDWRSDRRYGWQNYRSSNRAIFRAPRYIAPRGYGYGYRRWSPGLRIDSWFYGPSYWINDPWDYRLPPAYGDYRWVRYYDDAYLIDIRTGYIEDVIYDFFWR